MTQNTTADFQTNGLNMVTIQLQEDSVLYQEEACGSMMIEEGIGGQSLFILTTEKETSTLELGMMILRSTANSPESTCYSMQRTQEYSLKE